jgi:hypothetical protein
MFGVRAPASLSITIRFLQGFRHGVFKAKLAGEISAPS